MPYDVSLAAAGNKHSMCLTRCGKVFSWGKAVRDLKNNLTEFHEPKNPFDTQRFKGFDIMFTSIACGSAHSAAITTHGQLFMWGECSEGCLGRPPPENNPK